MMTISGLEDFAVMVRAIPCNDAAGHWALAVVHGATPYTPEIAHTTAYLADANWTATPIPFGVSEPYGKDIDVDIAIVGTTLYMFVTEATPGGGGATSRVDVYPFPNAVPAAMVASSTIDIVARNMVAAHIVKDHSG